MVIKHLFFDCETTGLKFWKNSIHQLSGIIEIGGEEKERFEFKIKPHPQAEIDDAALGVSGITRKELENYFEMKEVHRNLCALLSKYVDKFDKNDKFYLVGYNNASFDNPFLRAFFKQCEDEYFGSWFWSCPIDVMVLAGEYLKLERPAMKDFKLSTVASHLGIKVSDEKLHDACYDVELTREIYKYISIPV